MLSEKDKKLVADFYNQGLNSKEISNKLNLDETEVNDYCLEIFQHILNKINMKVIIKKWIEGKFVEIKSFSIDSVKQIRHHKEGLELILDGNVQLFDKQCVVEFE